MVDDEPSIGEILKDILGQWGYPVEVALTGPEALEWMQKWHPQVVFLDIWLKEEKEGVDLFYKIKKNWPDTDVILISGHGTVDLAVGLVKDGAWDFIEKPLSLDRLSQSLRRLQEYWSEKSQKKALLAQFQQPDGLVGTSPAIVEARTLLAQMMQHQGFGAIHVPFGFDPRGIGITAHSLSPHPWKSLVSLDAGQVPESLWRPYLLGQRPTSEQPYLVPVKGLLEQARQGTLVILNAQKLPSKIWQEWFPQDEGVRLQSELWPFNFDVFKVLLVSHQKNWIQALSRLMPVVVIPSLSERLPQDGPILWEPLSQSVARRLNCPVKTIQEDVFSFLSGYSWPGDLFEFEHWIGTIYLHVSQNHVTIEHVKKLWPQWVKERGML